MSVQLQSDVNSLSFAGLGAFSTVLGAMSADNVHPIAMIQLENLGSLFHVDGPNAGRVSEVLKRATSHPVGRLSLSIGWRRGDAVSILGDSAGGQAISLIMTAFAGIYIRQDYGLILSRLCSSLLPKSMPASNPMHLADVAHLVAAKAGQLSFGNLLAQQTNRVLSVYDQLGLESPKDLLDIPTTETIVQLFECLSHLQQDKYLVRISGSIGIIYLVALILFMFSHSTMVAVESVIIHDNENRSIIVEIAAEGPTKIQVETEVRPDHTKLTASITKTSKTYYRQRLSYLWDGWVVEALRVELGRYGLMLKPEFLKAFCEFMVQITPHLKLSIIGCQMSKSQKTFKELLGRDYQRRISSTYKEICHYTPDGNTLGPLESWQQFLSNLEKALEPIECTCGECKVPVLSWENNYTTCLAHELSRVIGTIFSNGIMCCVLEPQGTVTMNLELFGNHPSIYGKDIMRTMSTLGGLSSEESGPRSSPSMCYDEFLNLNRPWSQSQGNIIGTSFKGSSIYPAVLESFETPPDAEFAFLVRDGAFIYDGKYYERLSHDFDFTTRPSKQRLGDLSVQELAPITPSVLKEPLSLMATLRAGFDEILLSSNAQASGYFFPIDAHEAILSLMCLDISRGCAHDVDSPLPMELEQQVAIRKVGMLPIEKKINIYMTHGDRTSQFLAGGSVPSREGCLLLKSCISCGVQQAREGGYLALIVA